MQCLTERGVKKASIQRHTLIMVQVRRRRESLDQQAAIVSFCATEGSGRLEGKQVMADFSELVFPYVNGHT